MLGSAIHFELLQNNKNEIFTKTSTDLDLTNYTKTKEFINKIKPDVIINCASLVGGIKANIDKPAQFIHVNNQIQSNLIHLSKENRVKFFCFIGSSCIYPKFAKQPIKESELLTSKLEPTNEYYAIAKINGLKMLEAYNKEFGLRGVSVMPCNLYGPNDNFNTSTSHVLSSILKKSHLAKINNYKFIELWGDGSALREFMHVQDAAKAILLAINKTKKYDIVNIGTGKEVDIKSLALTINKITGFSGNIKWNKKMPNGTPRKILNISKLNKMGFKPIYNLENGIKNFYQHTLENKKI